jgi:hypothetical protein
MQEHDPEGDRLSLGSRFLTKQEMCLDARTAAMAERRIFVFMPSYSTLTPILHVGCGFFLRVARESRKKWEIV